MKKILLLFLLLALAGTVFAQTASVQVDANGTVINFQSPSTKAVNFPTGKLTVNGVQITGLESDASTTVKGVTKLSVAPVSSSNPIAVGDNDSRNTNARTPTAHASTHASGGSDVVTLIIGQITGLQSALDLKAPLASPTFTGVPLAPTAAVDTNTTQIATTGFVLAQAANATPLVASTGAVGTSTRYARQDHVHPAQTSVTGNAGTATALQTARTINGTSFDGTANITVTAAAGTLTGTTLASNVTASSLLSASGGSFGTAAFTASSAYATASQGVTTLSLATPNVLYATPITFSNSSGAWTGTLSLNTQSANTVFAGPTTGSAATPAMRALVSGDIPTLNQNTTGSAASLSISGQTGLLTFTGLTSTNRAKTVRDAADTILELGGSYTPTGTWTNLTLVTPTLGTPASGVVTNLTGTASININGTVGATTPNTGAFTSETFTLSLKSTTALATPSALSATQFTSFASTVSGAAIMGYGTTNDVSLMNRAGTVVLGVGPNTTLVNIPGALSVTGHTTFEGVTSTGATGSGNLVYSAGNPTFTGTPQLTNPAQAAISFTKGDGAAGMLVGRSYTSSDVNDFFVYDLSSSTVRLYIQQGVNIGGSSDPGAGNLAITGKVTTYNNIATEGNGLSAIVKATRVTAQTAANSSIASYTTPASDGSYVVSGNINVTAAVAISTSLNVDYTDETNTARTMIIPISGLGGTFLAGGLATSTGPFESSAMHIRTKASTVIKIYTASGTFTSVTYNAEGVIRKLQ